MSASTRCSSARAGRPDSTALHPGRRYLQQAARVIHLQGRVIEAEALVQHRLHVTAGGVTVAVGGDEDVCRERGEAARDFPYVKIVNLDHPRPVHERLADPPR